MGSGKSGRSAGRPQAAALLVLLVAFAMLAGCGASKEKALLKYVNDMSSVRAMEEKIFEDVTWMHAVNLFEGATSEEEMRPTFERGYEQLSEKTIPQCREWEEAAERVTSDDPEIEKLHGMYTEFVEKEYDRFVKESKMIKKRLEEGGVNAKMVELSQKVEKLNNQALELRFEYQTELQRLMDERGG